MKLTFHAQILEANEVRYVFTSNNSIGLLGSSNSFNKVKTQTAFSTKILKEDSKKKRWPVDLKPGGGFRAFHRVLVYLCAASGIEPSVTPRSRWSPLTDRWCIGRLWENGRCTQVLVNSFCSGPELYEWYCTGCSGVPLIGSCNISASVTKQICCKRSCPGGPVWTQAEVTVILVALHSSAYWPISILHRPWECTLFIFLFVCLFFLIIKFLDYFGFNFGFSVKELLPWDDCNWYSK